MSLEIRLHGNLEDFGEVWHLDVHSAAEAVRAIEANRPGFLETLYSGKYAFVATPLEGEVTDAEQVDIMDTERCLLPISHKQILHIMPIPEGEGETAIFVVATFLVDAGVAEGVALVLATVIVAVAVSVVLIGVSRMLMPAPPGMDDTQEGEESYYFNGPVNTARQGACVPVLYGGPLLVGSQVIGQSIVAEDINDGDAKTLKSTAYAEVIDAISEGPIAGFYNADLPSSVFLDGTPFRALGTDLFEGFQVDYKTGTQDQEFVNLNVASSVNASSLYNVALQIRQATGGLVRTTQNPNVGKIKITVNTGRFMEVQDDGDIKAIGVDLVVSIRGSNQANFSNAAYINLYGIASSSYYRTVSIPIESYFGDAPYDIKIERTTPDQQEDIHLTSEVFWATWSEEVVSNCSYPNTAFAVTRYDAEKFSSVPTRGFLMKGMLVRIPNNYDPIARTYSGYWNGEWLGGEANPTLTWTNNPAWIYYDLATHPRYGLGRYVTEELVDRWALYTIAQYCDGIVDDGYGGFEPRFVCNLYLQTKIEAFTALKDLASAFRSITYWVNGQLTLHQDAPEGAYAQFAPANVIGGAFSYSGTPKHTRYTAALVSWINPEDNYSTWIEYVEDEYGIQLYGLNETSITAVGCTSRGQAHRVGKYSLLQSRLATDAVSFKAGMDAMALTPGRIIKVIDPLHNQSGESVSGRIKEVTDLSTIVLDRPVTLEAGHTYHITVTLPGFTLQAVQVTNGAGTHTPPTAISLSAALAEAPLVGAMWSITDDANTARLYRVLTVGEAEGNADGFYEISGVRHDPGTLTESDETGILEPPDVPPINPGLASPSALRLEQGVLPVGITFRRYIDASWAAPDVGIVTEYYVTVYSPNGTEVTYSVSQTQYRIYDVVDGVYTVSVRAVNAAGQVSASVSSTTTVAALLPINLAYISGLELIGQGNDIEFTGPNAEFVWRLSSTLTGDMGDETFGGDTGIDDPWFRDYEVIVYNVDGTIRRVEHTYDRRFIYSLEKNQEDGGESGPVRTFEVGVAARDIFNRTTQEAFLEVTNPPPVGYTNINLTYGIESIIVSFGVPTDPDFVQTRVYVSATQFFTPSVSTIAYQGDDRVVTIGNLAGTDYFVQLEGVDAFGPAGIFTDELHVLIQSVERIHDQIAGQIQESWLYQGLNDRIDLIDIFEGGLVSKVAANTASIDLLQNSEFIGINTYYQGTDPVTNVPTPVLTVGDLWINTSSGDLISRWNGTGWDTLESGGNQTFYRDGPPTGPFDGAAPDPATLVRGDYWIDTHDYGTGPANTPWMWTGSEWVNIQDGLLLATAQQTTALQAEVDNPDTGTSALALYIQDLNVQVYDAGGLVSANADAIEALGATVTLKNSVYMQPSTQVPPSPVDGDLWIVTDYNNRLRSYVAGTGWVDASDSSATGATTWIAPGVPDPNDPKYHVGDLYFDATDANHPYQFDGTSWNDVRDTSSTGITTYSQPDEPGPGHVPPQTPSTGDLWFDTDADNKIHRYYGASQGGWIPVTDGSTIGVIPYIQPNMPQPPLIIGDIWIDTDDGDHPWEWNGTAWVDLVGSNRTITAATAVERYARVQSDGLAFAEYSIKVDVNGHIAGIGLGVSGSATGPIRSEIIMLADRFALGFPTTAFVPGVSTYYALGSWVTPSQAYINAHGTPEVQPDGETLYRWGYVYEVTVAGTATTEPTTWTQNIGGFTNAGTARFTCRAKGATLPFVTGNVITNLGEEPPITRQGIVIDAVMIQAASIQNAHILDATIQSAKIVSLDVGKITAGTLAVNTWIRVGGADLEINASKHRITVQDKQGTPRDRVEIGDLSTGSAITDYGLIVRDAANNIMLQSGGSATINGTYISNATIRSASIENSLQSSNWSGAGGNGFQLKVNGTGAGSASFNELSIYNNLGELILHSGSSLGDFSKAGSGVNIVPGDYANFENPYTQFYSTQCALTIDPNITYFYGSSLKVDVIANANCFFGLAPANDAAHVNMRLTPGKKWIVSFWLRQNTKRVLQVYFSDGISDYGAQGSVMPSVTNAFERVSTIIDMTPHTTVKDVLLHFYLFSASSADECYIDGVMVEEQVGSGTYPSAYYAADTTDNAGSANMVFNSQMYPKDSGWLYAESGVSNPSAWYSEDRDIVTDPTGTWWVNPGIMSLVQTDGSLTGFSYTFQKTMMAIDSTKRYQFGALTGAHRCDGYVGVQLFAADRATLLATVQSAVNTSLKQGGNTISGYFDHTRFLEPADIPAGASYARLILLKDPTYSGASPASSYFFCTHAHFCEVKFGQTTFTPYSPGFESIGQNNPIQPNTRSTYIKDLTVDTAAIADLAVDTLKVAGQAITTPVSNAAALALSLGSDWTTIISKSIAITSTQSVSASIAVNGYLSISGGVGGTSGGTAEIRILKNDSVLGPPILYSQSWGFEYAGESSSYPLSTGATYVDTAPPLNQTVTYQIQGRRTGNGNASITYASIVIMNVKK